MTKEYMNILWLFRPIILLNIWDKWKKKQNLYTHYPYSRELKVSVTFTIIFPPFGANQVLELFLQNNNMNKENKKRKTIFIKGKIIYIYIQYLHK